MAAMAAAVHAFADRIWAEARTSPDMSNTTIACKAGCGWCCHQQVAIAPAEAMAIANHLQLCLDAPQRAALAQRVAALDAVTRGLTAIERGRLRQPCAFLLDGHCAIYPARPLRCRGVYSQDESHCRWAMANPDDAAAARRERYGPGPFVAAPSKIMDAALTGLVRASRDLGLEAEGLELTAAVHLALTAPDLERRTLAGESAFAAAALPLSP